MPDLFPLKASKAQIDAAVQAFYDAQLQHAREEIEASAFDWSDLAQIFLKVRAESETSQVLVVASYLEDQVTRLIKRQLLMPIPLLQRSAFSAGLVLYQTSATD